MSSRCPFFYISDCHTVRPPVRFPVCLSICMFSVWKSVLLSLSAHFIFNVVFILQHCWKCNCIFIYLYRSTIVLRKTRRLVGIKHFFIFIVLFLYRIDHYPRIIDYYWTIRRRRIVRHATPFHTIRMVCHFWTVSFIINSRFDSGIFCYFKVQLSVVDFV